MRLLLHIVMDMASELVESWKVIQAQLRQQMVVKPIKKLPRFVAGADMAFAKNKRLAFAVAVVFDRTEQRIVEVATTCKELEYPYIPGYLSFREGPALLEVIGKLRHSWGVLMCDGQGFAHPRRCGLACYVGIKLDVPCIGVGKSRLIGTFDEPRTKAGDWSELRDKEETIGIALRTQDGTRPVFVSVGHRSDLESARQLVLACCTKHRVPEPTRQADAEVSLFKKKKLGEIPG